jgi:dephospho-CoA kinase
VVVAASDATCLRRVMARDSSTQERVLARMRAQLPLSEKAKLADYVIDNDGPLAAAQAQADAVLNAICGQLGIDAELYPVPV